MVTGVFYRVQFRLGISSSFEVLDGLGTTFRIHPVGITVWGEADQIKALSGEEGRKLTGKCYGYLERCNSIHERHPGVSSWSQYMCCRRSSAKTILRARRSTHKYNIHRTPSRG